MRASISANFCPERRRGGLLREYRIPLEVREAIAAFLFAVGRRPLHSTSIAGTETSGYGELDDYGFWEYPLYAA